MNIEIGCFCESNINCPPFTKKAKYQTYSSHEQIESFFSVLVKVSSYDYVTTILLLFG